MTVRHDIDDSVAAFRRLLPTLRRAGADVAHSGLLRGEYTTARTSHGDCELAFHRARRVKAPVVLELHGGGFVVGEVAADDAIRELLRAGLDCTVVGVGYCLAPEHPYPAALEQLEDVLAYLADGADQLDLDVSRVALVGFSAGANLATVAAMRATARCERRYRLVAQVLHYPFLDAATDPAGKALNPWDIPAETMAVFNELYAPPSLRDSPEISPVRATARELAGLPPALIVAGGRDALAPEARVYARHLTEAGVPTVLKMSDHAHHGYVEQWFGPDAGQASGPSAGMRDARSLAEAGTAMELTVNFLAERFAGGLPSNQNEKDQAWTSD